MLMETTCRLMGMVALLFSSRRRHTRAALVRGVQTCALPDLAQERVRFISFGRNARCCNPARPRMEDSVGGIASSLSTGASCDAAQNAADIPDASAQGHEIGRASCRERVVQYV